MPTRGQSRMLSSNINMYVSLAFIATFTFACGLILWHAAFDTNPIEKLLLSSAAATEYSNY